MFYTTLALCALAILHVALSFMAVSIRRKERIGLNHGKNNQLASIMRAQTNTIEYSVWFMPLLALLEYQYYYPTVCAIIALLFVLSRYYHSVAFVRNAGGASRGRAIGTVVSILAIIGLVLMHCWLLLGI